MTLSFTKPKTLIIFLGGGLVLTLLVIILQMRLTPVFAQVIPIVIHEDHLEFGTVFPGEHRSGNFVVNIASDYQGDPVTYHIIQKRKPLPEGYDGEGDPDLPGYYRNLCPFLTKTNNEGEGDTESQAMVGGLDDLADSWIVDFSVPAILGYVAQDHSYGVVSTDGDYGCDISLDVDLEWVPVVAFAMFIWSKF